MKRLLLKLLTGLGLVPALIAPAAHASAPHIFAGQFLSDPPAFTYEPGHFDKDSQLYVSDLTGQPQFADRARSEKGFRVADTSIKSSGMTSMTGSSSNPDSHIDTVPDGFD